MRKNFSGMDANGFALHRESPITDPASTRGESYGAMVGDRGERAPVGSGQMGRSLQHLAVDGDRSARPALSPVASRRLAR
ncbi:hypothetical protein ACFY25_14855 [[Kitasatospora] papulosa]|uniref:hypothetical protein n=1 Tax=[Kitasatospora] papulosa TaxID=1464011 RepID=UPI00369D5DA4